MRFRKLFFLPLAVGLAEGSNVVAQEPIRPPAPLARPAPAATTGGETVTLISAQRAQELGLSSLAAELYGQLLETPGADRGALILARATALLEAGLATEAEQALAGFSGTRGAAWHLRAGLAALQLKKRDEAQREWDATKMEELPVADRPWYWFLQGALWDTVAARDGSAVSKANEAYVKAENSAATELARVRFQLAAEQVRLRFAPPADAAIEEMRRTFERLQGRAGGYEAARLYAVMLFEARRTIDAVAFLQQRVLLTLPPQERERADDFRLLLGLIADRGREVAGRNALTQLIETGVRPDKQRAAVQLLAEASQTEPGRGQFRAVLSKLIGVATKHPILDSLLLFRAQLALGEKNYGPAEDDARSLLQQFPGSQLRVHAFGVLTAAAWEQRRYRLAADSAAKARSELAEGPVRAQLGLLVAEAWYRGGDFRAAADAYEAVLRETPAGVAVGTLMYQRVLAEIKTGSPEAARVLDELETNPAFDTENRWQAEWNLARTMQTQGEAKIAEAFARVTKLLGGDVGGATPISAELRVRMQWLQARLAFESGQREKTLELVEALTKSLAGVEAALSAEIASTATILKARAEFELGREAVALETLKTLREKFPKTEAAVSSYLIEADHFAAQDKIDKAQKTLTDLADNADYKDSPYTPLALYRSALLSERLGQPQNLADAIKRIEELVNKFPQSDLVFGARLKQGDLLRKRNDFPAAQRAYEDLLNKPGAQEDLILAELALAECHNAQSATDPSHAETARVHFEHLHDRADASPAVRVEAGYNLGALLARRGAPAKGREVWWRDVVMPFLMQPKPGVTLGATGPYWMARTLLDLGTSLEQEEKFDEAKEAYLLIIKKNLSYGQAVAKTRLARFGVPEASR